MSLRITDASLHQKQAKTYNSFRINVTETSLLFILKLKLVFEKTTGSVILYDPFLCEASKDILTKGAFGQKQNFSDESFCDAEFLIIFLRYCSLVRIHGFFEFAPYIK